MGFEDSSWIEFRPITLLFGRNSSGKSAILRSLLLLKQSLDSPSRYGPLLFVDDEGLDFGDFEAIVFNHEVERIITFGFRHSYTKSPDVWFELLSEPEFRDSEFMFESRDDDDDGLVRLLSTLSNLAIDIKLVGDEENVLSIYTELSFKKGDNSSQASFYAITLRNAKDEVILSLTEDKGKASGWKADSDLIELTEKEWDYVDLSFHQGFFPQISIGTEFFDPKDSSGIDNYTFDSIGSVRSIYSVLYPEFLSWLDLKYLGPLRPAPQRFYYSAGQSRSNSASADVVQAYLDSATDPQVDQKLQKVQQWLRECLGVTFSVELIGESQKHLYEIVFHEENMGGVSAGIREVGSGLSQVLPVLIAAMLAPEGTLVVIEQPELHLHPKAQAALADLFIIAANSGVRFLIETHSEHLLLRTRLRVVETTARQVVDADNELHLDSESVLILFADRISTVSFLQSIELDQLGDYQSMTDDLREFFAQDMDDILKLNQAARIARKQEEVL